MTSVLRRDHGKEHDVIRREAGFRRLLWRAGSVPDLHGKDVDDA